MGEKRRFSSEEDIRHLMSQLPPIQDKRSKSKIYEELQMKMKERQKPKVAFRQRWIPLVTASFAILLFIVMAPHLFNKGEQVNEMSEEALDVNMFSSENEENSINGFARGVPEGFGINAIQHESEERMITVPYTDEFGEFIIPFSFVIHDTANAIEQMEYYLNAKSKEFLPSNSSTVFQGTTLKEENGELILSIPEGKFVGGSAGVTLFLEGVQVILDSLGYEEVKLYTNDQPSIQLDQLGDVSELKNSRQTGGYFRYGEQILVPGELSYFNRVDVKDKSFENILHEMEYPQDVGAIESPFPEGVSLEKISVEANEASIELNGGEKIDNNKESQLFIEAMLLTAKQFDIDFVTFSGVKVEQVGPYHLSEPLQTNIAPNIMKPSS